MAKLLSVMDVSKRLGVHHQTVRNLIKKGVIPVLHIGPKILRVPEDAIDTLIKEQLAAWNDQQIRLK
ncbi:hypothetical protein CTI14_01795 [Methylobacterium radiotolerans]|nr:hypothetical protein CTI14_01795 [Methylobacterium radiotolerans]